MTLKNVFAWYVRVSIVMTCKHNTYMSMGHDVKKYILL